MRSVVTAVLALALVAVAGCRAHAPARPGDDVRTRTRQLLNLPEGFQKELAGTSWFGMYFQDRTNVGHMRFEVAPARPSDAVYQVTTEFHIGIGPVRLDGTEVALLDSSLGLVSLAGEGTQQDPEGNQSQTLSKIQRVEDQWVRVSVEEGEEKRFTILDQGPNYGDTATLMLLVRTLDLSKQTTYRMPYIRWDGDTGEAAYADMEVEVSAAEPFDFRGEEVQAHFVEVRKTGETETYVVTPDHRVVAVLFEGQPMKLLAGTEEEVKASLGVSDPETQEILDVVGNFFRIIADPERVDDLDAIVDWEALRAQAGKSSEPLEEFVAQSKADIAAKPLTVPPEQIEMMISMLQAEVEGDTATVSMPGAAEAAFGLRRTEVGWRIVRLPQM